VWMFWLRACRGYLCSQIPGAGLIQKNGAKVIGGLSLIGTCGIFALLPLLARLGRSTAETVRIMAACLTVCGFCQGPLMPGQMVMRRNWLPKTGSPERPIHARVVAFGGQFASIAATSVTPWLATKFGWSSVNTVMGGSGLLCAALWFAKCVEVPQHWRRRGDASSAAISSTPAAAAVTIAAAAAPKKAQAFNFGIFRDPAVIATTWCNMSTLNCMYTMSSYVPTIFIESLNCTPMQAAAFLVLQSPIRFIGGFVTACTESALLKKGVAQINIRKRAQMLAAIGQSAFMVAFAFCRSAPLAALCINADTVFASAVQAGFNPNMIEIGGDDTATLNAVGNTLGTSWGLLVPILAAYCKRSFGSYAPVFIQAAVFHLLGSLLFFKCARLTSRAEEEAAPEVASRAAAG
jgi:sugar phosphate permease